MVRASLGMVVGGERTLYWKLTARDNLMYFSSLYKMKKQHAKKRIEELLETFKLSDRADEGPRACRRRLFPLGHRRRLHRSRPRPGRQVPVPAAGPRGRGPGRLSRCTDALLPQLAADARLRDRWGPCEDVRPRQEALASVPAEGGGESARAALRGPERAAVQHRPRQ